MTEIAGSAPLPHRLEKAVIEVIYAVPGAEQAVVEELATRSGGGRRWGYTDRGRADRIVVLESGEPEPSVSVRAPTLEVLRERYDGPALVLGTPRESERAVLSHWREPAGAVVRVLDVPGDGFALVVEADEGAMAFVGWSPRTPNDEGWMPAGGQPIRPRWWCLLDAWQKECA